MIISLLIISVNDSHRRKPILNEAEEPTLRRPRSVTSSALMTTATKRSGRGSVGLPCWKLGASGTLTSARRVSMPRNANIRRTPQEGLKSDLGHSLFDSGYLLIHNFTDARTPRTCTHNFVESYAAFLVSRDIDIVHGAAVSGI